MQRKGRVHLPFIETTQWEPPTLGPDSHSRIEVEKPYFTRKLYSTSFYYCFGFMFFSFDLSWFQVMIASTPEIYHSIRQLIVLA